ncbi:hypothetical protein L6452_36444 [Arctium lappa]|uniref:Uncharacterized protein n=1 Tax=Arctium lappa TaxID=4217 RepID=A0ACB8Y8I1_ARCLA|nr:hypothetical protein L6452_36444 [Arctium lappa]
MVLLTLVPLTTLHIDHMTLYTVFAQRDKVEEQMQTVQTKQTVEGMVLNASGIEKEDNIGKQMHIVQAKERGASIDPKESMTEKDDQSPKKKIKAIEKSDKKVAITQKSPNTRSVAKNKSVGKSKGNEKEVINSSVRSLSLTKGNKKVVRKNKEKVVMLQMSTDASRILEELSDQDLVDWYCNILAVF